MQNENTAVKQDYENLMADFVAACKSEREANDMLRAFVGKFMMPIFESEYRPEFPLHAMRSEVIGDENVRPQSDNSLCTGSGIFWYTHYKDACAQITKLQQQNGFSMGDLKAEIEFRQKAEAENLVLKGKIKELQPENQSKGIFLVHECEGGTSKQVGFYVEETQAEAYAKDMSLKNKKCYKVFKQVSVFAKPIK